MLRFLGAAIFLACLFGGIGTLIGWVVRDYVDPPELPQEPAQDQESSKAKDKAQ